MPRGTRGFGLLEVMISGSILLIGIVAVAHTVTQIEYIYQHQRYITGAVHVGEGTLEELLGRYIDDAELVAGTTTTGPEYSVDGRVVPAGTGFYTVAWAVFADAPVPGMRQVVVTVSWIENTVPKTFALRAARS